MNTAPDSGASALVLSVGPCKGPSALLLPQALRGTGQSLAGTAPGNRHDSRLLSHGVSDLGSRRHNYSVWAQKITRPRLQRLLIVSSH